MNVNNNILGQMDTIINCLAKKDESLKVTENLEFIERERTEEKQPNDLKKRHLIYLRIANFILNNKEHFNIFKLNDLQKVLKNKISVIRADTEGIWGFFRYLFRQSDKCAHLKKKEYLEALQGIVENIVIVKEKEKKEGVEKEAVVSKEEERVLDSNFVEAGQEIEKAKKAIVWVLKIKLDGLKGLCLYQSGSISAFIQQQAEYLNHEEGQSFLLELQKYEADLKKIPYYAKREVQNDIHTNEEIVEKVKYIMERSTSLHKQAKSLLPYFPKGTEARKTFVNLLTTFAEKLNEQQQIFKTPSSDKYIGDKQRELSQLKKRFIG